MFSTNTIYIVPLICLFLLQVALVNQSQAANPVSYGSQPYMTITRRSCRVRHLGSAFVSCLQSRRQPTVVYSWTTSRRKRNRVPRRATASPLSAVRMWKQPVPVPAEEVINRNRSKTYPPPLSMPSFTGTILRPLSLVSKIKPSRRERRAGSRCRVVSWCSINLFLTPCLGHSHKVLSQ